MYRQSPSDAKVLHADMQCTDLTRSSMQHHIAAHGGPHLQYRPHAAVRDVLDAELERELVIGEQVLIGVGQVVLDDDGDATVDCDTRGQDQTYRRISEACSASRITSHGCKEAQGRS